METRFRRFVWRSAAAIATVALAASWARFTATTLGSVERMYVFNCGEIAIKDISHWSPGVNPGQPFEFSNHCYLIRHAKGWMLWDSGYSDAVTARPEGVVAPTGLNVGRMPRTLASQLAEIGLTPSHITHLAFSHMHGDHVGNANLFSKATLYIQETEYDAAFGPDFAKFSFNVTTYEKVRDNRVIKLRGDHDVFGDGSVMIVSTPGHTPGHQSLLVRLPRRGPVILSGDLVHFQDNWDHRRVPAFNDNASSRWPRCRGWPNCLPRKRPSSGSTTTGHKARAFRSRPSTSNSPAYRHSAGMRESRKALV